MVLEHAGDDVDGLAVGNKINIACCDVALENAVGHGTVALEHAGDDVEGFLQTTEEKESQLMR